MPNICENYVLIRGSRESLDVIKDARLDMFTLVPPPALFEGEQTRWDWIQEHYSSKWICNMEENGPPEINDQGVYLLSHFESAWVLPYAFYQNLIRRFPDVSIEYQYHSWESGIIGHGKMDAATIETEPTHCSYNTPDELNAAIREYEGAWMVEIGNPHFAYDSQTGLFKWQTAGGGGCEWVSETDVSEAGGAAAASSDADSC